MTKTAKLPHIQTASPSAFAPAGIDRARIAIVHDFFRCYAGSERVVGEMLRVFPQADIFSLFDFLPDDQRSFLQGKTVRTSFLQNMPLARSRHRAYLPLMPLAIESLDVSAYDLILSSSHLAAKGVLTAPHQLHICYCHSPARFAWDLQEQYLTQSGLHRGLRGWAARLLLHYIRGWDVKSANGVDLFLSNSHYVRRRIEKAYRRDATTIYPPVAIEKFPLQPTKQNYYVTVSRLVPYKRVDLIVEAFSRMPEKQLVVIGEGPEAAKIRRLARSNVQLLGYQPDNIVLHHLQNARAFLFAAEEDFGIAPVEAQACGTPIIAFQRGGATETVIDGKTGLFFPHQTPESLIQAVKEFEQQSFNPIAISSHAASFSREAFQRNFRHEVATAWTLFQHRQGMSSPK